MMYRFLLALVLATTSLGARAQGPEPSRFFPFAPGNRWEYQTTTVDSSSFGRTVTNGFTVVAVLRDTLVAGERHSVYSITSLDAQGAHGLTEEHRGYLRPDGSWESDGFGYLVSGGSPIIQLGPGSPGGAVSIGDTSYPVGATARYAYYVGCGSGGTYCDYERLHATDLGLFFGEYQKVRSGSGPNFHVETYRLRYARVGGATYGAPVVPTASEPPAPGSGLWVAVFPNPVHDWLGLALEEGWAGPLDVRVYDGLGRLVWSGQEAAGPDLRLGVEGLRPGMYVVRVNDGRGATASTGFVRLSLANKPLHRTAHPASR